MPIVVLHGLYGSKRNWKGVAERLSREAAADVYTLDLRHHGDSPESGPFTMAAMAKDVCRFLDTAGVSPAFLLGHSVGGKVALQAALSCPSLTAGLILVDISPFDLPRAVCDELRSITDALIGLPLEKIHRRSEAEQLLMEKIPDMQVARFLLQNLAKNSETAGPAYRWQIGLQAISAGLEEACRSVLPGASGGTISAGEINSDGESGGTEPFATLPFLCIRGGSSPFFPEEDVERLRILVPSLEAQTIADAGHWLHVEQPDSFIDIVGDFIRRR